MTRLIGTFLLLGLVLGSPLRAFISPDPEGHVASMDLYSYCNGDPVNQYDADGRIGKGAFTGQGYNDASAFGATVGSQYLVTQATQLLSSGMSSVTGQNLMANLLGGSQIVSGALGPVMHSLTPMDVMYSSSSSYDSIGNLQNQVSSPNFMNPAGAMVNQDGSINLRGVGSTLSMVVLARFGEGESAPMASPYTAAKETQVVLSEGQSINRVWDSRWTPGSSYSGPFGGSYSPNGALPINATTAIETRGLNIPSVLNNAERGGVYNVTREIPATLRTSIGGTEPELMIAPQYRQYLNLLDQSVSTIPPGR